MTTLDVQIEAAAWEARRAARRLLWAKARLHMGMLMQVFGMLAVVLGVSLIVGALAGVLYGMATALILVGAAAFAWGFFKEAGRI